MVNFCDLLPEQPCCWSKIPLQLTMSVGWPCVPGPKSEKGIGLSTPKRKLHFFPIVLKNAESYVDLGIDFLAIKDTQVNKTPPNLQYMNSNMKCFFITRTKYLLEAASEKRGFFGPQLQGTSFVVWEAMQMNCLRPP